MTVDSLPLSEKTKSGMASLIDAVSTQARVINALILRETKTRYGEHKIGFVWAILEPAIMVSIFVAFFAVVRSDNPGGMALVPFMLTGLVPFSFFKDSMTQMQGAIAGNRQLFAFPQVTTFDVIIARGILEIVILASVFTILLILVDLGGWPIRIERPLDVLAALGLLSMMGLGFGFFFASLSPVLPSSRQISGALFGRPLFFSSGVFFTAESIPPFVRDYLLYNPLLHSLELLRSGFFYEFETTHGKWDYALSWAVGLFAFGLLFHQAMRRRAIVGI